jgi:hypothetical protein
MWLQIGPEPMPRNFIVVNEVMPMLPGDTLYTYTYIYTKIYDNRVIPLVPGGTLNIYKYICSILSDIVAGSYVIRKDIAWCYFRIPGRKKVHCLM